MRSMHLRGAGGPPALPALSRETAYQHRCWACPSGNAACICNERRCDGGPCCGSVGSWFQLCMSDWSLHGKTVMITGATSGLGKVAALALAGMGARLYL